MTSDSELLRRYAETRDEAAFGEVVRRHTDLVYSAALRLVAGDAHLAQDVAQQVFTTLAKQAGPLARRASLAGWLYTTTRYAASVAVRGERRRRTHEQEAMTMQHHDDKPDIDWAQLRPNLDDAMGQLRERDREAVLLRYFQGKSHREAAALLGLNEESARKRVDRAVEKLRVYLQRRGVVITSAVLVTALTAHSVKAAPAGLAAALGGASLAQAARGGVAGGILKGITMTTKTKMTLATAAMLCVAAVPLAGQYEQLARVNAANDDLAQKTAALQADANKLRAQLRGNSPAATVAVANGTYYIPVSKETIKNLHIFPAYEDEHGDFKLDKLTAGLLSLTADETKLVQGTLEELKNRVQAYQRSALKQITPDEVHNFMTRDFLAENPGKQSIYQVPSMSDEDLAALQSWFSQNITSALGKDRAEIFLDKAVTNADLGLVPGNKITYVFSDTMGADGATPETAWEIDNSSGTGRNSGGNDPYPQELAFLFKDIRKSAQPATTQAPQPARPSAPANTPEYLAVQNNLRQIATSAQQYMLNNRTWKVSYAQLTADPNPLLKPLAPVAGESYDNIVVQSSDTSISADIPGVGVVKYDLNSKQ